MIVQGNGRFLKIFRDFQKIRRISEQSFQARFQARFQAVIFKFFYLLIK